MASLYSTGYNQGVRSGTSGAEVSDIRPEQAYDVDLRRLDPEERRSARSLNSNQDRIARFFKAARAAGAYKQKTDIDEPMIRGKTPRQRVAIKGVELPTRGDSGGRSGSTAYAHKPQPQFGKSFI